MLQKYKNISTDGEVMSKIKVACFFWDTVYNASIIFSSFVLVYILLVTENTLLF